MKPDSIQFIRRADQTQFLEDRDVTGSTGSQKLENVVKVADTALEITVAGKTYVILAYERK